ncbi:MAG: MFS transporter [Gammaproteobacteria bacterium]|nr:MAG: MFS transporter [Gammaproteobacteria bacterium]
MAIAGSAPETPPPAAPGLVGRAPAYAWWVCAVLCFLSINAFIDRQIINLLVGPLKDDLGLSDVQISLLQGFAFALFHALAAIPLGRMADRYSRKLIIIYGLVFWTAACAGSGLVSTFMMLFVMRAMIGAGEATLSPSGYSLLADYFPRNQLGRAISLFLGSGFVGSGIALILGGAVLGHVVTSEGSIVLPLVGEVRAWQAAFLIASLPGVLCVLLMLTVREPVRTSFGRMVDANLPMPSLREVLAFMVRQRRAMGAIFIGFSLLAAMQFGLGAWTPEFFIRIHGWSRSDIGYAYGLNFVIVGTLGVVVGGWLSDWLATRGYRDANLRTGFIAGLCAFPFVVGFPLMPTGQLSFLLLIPATFFGTMPFGAGTAALPLLTPNRMRAVVVALYLIFANLIGQGLGPFSVAALTDFVFGDPGMLWLSISVAGGLLLALAVTIIGIGLPAISASLREAEAGERP